jgi:hypothetical protein
MRHGSTPRVTRFRLALCFTFLTAFLAAGAGAARADDRADARALVGKWKYQGFLGDDFELKADGTRLTYGVKTGWAVKNGKFIITNLLGMDNAYEFTLSPDNNTLRLNGETYKRQR